LSVRKCKRRSIFWKEKSDKLREKGENLEERRFVLE